VHPGGGDLISFANKSSLAAALSANSTAVMADQTAPSAAPSARFPLQFRFIIGNEACERFSFYGMRSILVVFMTQHLLFAKNDATGVFHSFVAACYLMPLLGGFIADRFFGKYNTILYISLFYCLGHGVLAFWESKTGLYVGLALLAFGSGGIKPCVSSFLGDQFNRSNSHLLKRAYDLFYWSINFGSFFSTLLIPYTLKVWGSRIAFGIPGILMGIATVVFWLGRRHYTIVPPGRKSGAAGFLPVLFHALTRLAQRKPGEGFWDSARDKFRPEEVDGAKAAAAIFGVFATVPMFWALFDQHSSTWVLQAQQMDRRFLGLELEASQIAALNPAMVMVLIPIFSFGVYPLVGKLGVKVSPLRRMSAGMVLAGFSFVVAAMIQSALDHGAPVNIGWQFIQYLILTSAEVMISITGLEFAYTQAPRAMKSTIMSFWMLTVFAGNAFTALIAKLNRFEGASQFLFFGVAMFVVSGVFILGAWLYKERNYVESDAVTSA
jgi:POT family proton-dependent oligopeptide transporter